MFLNSHEWFKEFTNGTVLQEAIRIGRERHHDCGRVYKECFVTPRILKSVMMQFGAIWRLTFDARNVNWRYYWSEYAIFHMFLFMSSHISLLFIAGTAYHTWILQKLVHHHCRQRLANLSHVQFWNHSRCNERVTSGKSIYIIPMHEVWNFVASKKSHYVQFRPRCAFTFLFLHNRRKITVILVNTMIWFIVYQFFLIYYSWIKLWC